MSFDKQHVMGAAAARVTQADRDAAAELFARFTAYSDREERAAVFRRGEMDDSEFVLSFAKHRLAASSRQEERLRALERLVSVADLAADTANTSLMDEAIQQARAALEPHHAKDAADV